MHFKPFYFYTIKICKNITSQKSQKGPVSTSPTSFSRYWHLKIAQSNLSHLPLSIYPPSFPFFHKRWIWVVQVIAWVMAILGNEIFAETLCPWKLIQKNIGGMVETAKRSSNEFSCFGYLLFLQSTLPFLWSFKYIYTDL